MKKLVINGGKKLKGEVTISGAKNSAVALIPAAILADSPVILEGVPDIKDVHSLKEILELMGVDVSFENNRMKIDPTNMESVPMPSGKIQSLRASYYFMGALLGKFNEAIVGLPGGCYLGPRPIDLHIKGFESLGATATVENNANCLSAPNGLTGTRIYLDMVSIGATINVMLAAVKANGRTVIENAAKEPEIIDVATLLNNMGAKIRGAGTNEIRIDGVNELHGCRHAIIPDRIEAGTYLALAASYGDGIKVKNVIYEHLESFIAKLAEMGVKMDIGEDTITVHPTSGKLKPVNVMTVPYPGFATDLQQPITPLLLLADGMSIVTDTIYEQRVNHIAELKKMGADAHTEGNNIIIKGDPNLKLVGAEVSASDLRAGACLVIAGLMAQGVTKISNVTNILRGYDSIIEKLQALGSDIWMEEEE